MEQYITELNLSGRAVSPKNLELYFPTENQDWLNPPHNSHARFLFQMNKTFRTGKTQ